MSDAGRPDVFVHERGLCESDTVGAGTRVWAFAHVMAGAIVGRDCNLGDHTFVETGALVGDRVTLKNGVALWDRVTVGDDVFIGPYAVFTNDLDPRAAFHKDPREFLPTSVEAGATIGANATIVCGTVIGSGAFVGAGAVVVHDVPAHAVAVGNPAVPVGWMCTCGARLAGDVESPPSSLACVCGREYGPRPHRPGGLAETSCSAT